jgi:hypothetical protein
MNKQNSNYSSLFESTGEPSALTLPPPEAPGNLSTYSLRSDHKGLVYVVIRRHAIAIRMSDYQLSATAICNAIGLNKY